MEMIIRIILDNIYTKIGKNRCRINDCLFYEHLSNMLKSILGGNDNISFQVTSNNVMFKYQIK